MSRSDYNEDSDGNWNLIRWRGAVASAIRGRRGQAFLRELLAAFDALPEKRLIADDITREGEVCAIGAVARVRGIDVSGIDPEDHERVAETFGVAHALMCELFYTNDEYDQWVHEEVYGPRRYPWDRQPFVSRRITPEERFERVRAWVISQIKEGKTT